MKRKITITQNHILETTFSLQNNINALSELPKGAELSCHSLKNSKKVVIKSTPFTNHRNGGTESTFLSLL